EIDPEDSPKPRPERDSGAYGPRQRQCTQQRESRYEHASGKISAPSRERQITPAFSKSAEFCNTTLCFVSCPYYFSPLYASGHRDRHYGLDPFRAARARHWLGQIREMESAQPARAPTGSDGSGASRKNA